MQRILFFITLGFIFAASCKKNSSLPPIDDYVDLDGKLIQDSSLIKPSDYLLSAAIPNPTPADLAKPVLLAVHGFSASTFEWTELRDWAKNKNDFFVSLILLGGHGRDYNDFKNASWMDWQQPILNEYNLLRSQGYRNINLVGSSTGCPLILDMIASRKISSDVLKHIFFIDPIIVSSNKNLSLVSVLGTVIPYTTTDLAPGENGYWYKYRPKQALQQLENLLQKERKYLQKGIALAPGVNLKVYKSIKDDAADPVSAVLISKGIKGVETIMVNSDLHVFTRLHGRKDFTAENIALQLETFEEIHSAL
jgi:carboxylesterase